MGNLPGEQRAQNSLRQQTALDLNPLSAMFYLCAAKQDP